MKVTPRKAVAYIRTGSRSIGFVLPEEKELMQQFFDSTTMPHDNELIGKRCWLYYRADSSQFSPLPDLCEQGRGLINFAMNKKMKVVASSLGVAPCGIMDQGSLRTMLDAAAQGLMDVVLVHSRECLSCTKNLREILSFEMLMAEYGVKVIYTSEIL